jgi:hypothetical protein
MAPELKPAYKAWLAAEIEAQDSYMKLRGAVVQYIEGIRKAPPDAMLEQAMAARIRNLSAMLALIRAKH